MIRVYYVLRVRHRVPGNTRSPSEMAEERLMRAKGMAPSYVVSKEPVAKFFRREHAEAHAKTSQSGNGDVYEIEVREEHENQQHESHVATVRALRSETRGKTSDT